MGRKIAIVGGGIAGASTARQLGDRGHQVTVFEQFPLGHEMGSSHGRSRIVRRAYADCFYTECMREAYPMWAELERASGFKLLHEVGLLYFGEAEMETLKSTEEGLREFQIPYQKYFGQQAKDVFPQLELEENEVGIFTPEAGWVSADQAVLATWKLAKASGVKLVENKAAREDLIGFDKVVITAGAWTPDWMPNAPVEVTLQTFGYLDAKIEGPVWIEDTPDLLYGFPSDESGLKIGVHRPGRRVDASSGDRTPDANDIELIRSFAERRFGIQNACIKNAKGCLYTNTETEDFLICQLDESTIVASACSGHGFKFGPWFGKLLADVVEERRDLAAYGRFLV